MPPWRAGYHRDSGGKFSRMLPELHPMLLSSRRRETLFAKRSHHLLIGKS
ncbi:hypothetical protein ACHAXS_002603 [Conticribra weissflogii]